MIKNLKNNKITIGLMIVTLVVTMTLGTIIFIPNETMSHSAEMGSNEYNKEIVKETKAGIATLLADGRYKCCMKEPCARCFAKSKNHDKELVCDCMEDLYNGKHPCGECIGEILEGEGNPLMAEYFATAIAEKFGQQYLPVLKQIISEQYENMPIENQL